MKPLLLLLPIVAMGGPAHAQTAPPPLTLEQALSLPPDQLADIALRQMGARMTRVTRPTASGNTPRPNSLTSLVFATAPHATATVGLCAANRAEVEFETPVAPPFSANGPTTPARARLLRAAEVYKVVGEIEPYVEVSEDRAAEESRRCAGAGSVIPARTDDFSQPYFFAFEGDVDPVMALLVLQQAIADAQAETYRTISCAPPPRGQPASPECRTPPTLLGGINLASLVDLRMAPAGLNGPRRLIRARFLIPGAARRYWALTIEADITREPDGSEVVARLGRTEIARTGAPPLD